MLSGDEVKEVKKIIQDVLIEQYSALDDLTKGSLKSIAADMYSHGLILEITKDIVNFNEMIRDSSQA